MRWGLIKLYSKLCIFFIVKQKDIGLLIFLVLGWNFLLEDYFLICSLITVPTLQFANVRFFF